ncbi:C40 family peptidase [Solicola gregarius]|uniref:C40 family peptidase n=1 Tax=Solicola gregarius TaxID=2908642 RepID=A0AA46TGE3_9ACTN|nr:NlpC/P60 family protein [Solicola gregarius]UYM04882.1 C40 family peptidase [Solicola gregarius]
MTTVISVPVTTVWKGPDAPRDVDAAIVARTPDPVAWNAALLAAPPSALHGRAETQALYGEPVRVVSERAGWVELVLPWQPSSADPAGYPGWVPAAHVSDTDPVDGPLAVVTTPTVTADDRELSYGTVLPETERGPAVVRLAGPDGPITAPTSAVARVPEPTDVRDVEALLTEARQFVGMRYVWGGTSGWGLDCSGFVHLVHRRAGVTVPRDAYDQIEAATRLDPTEASTGDLYFFGLTSRGITHVGFATNPAGAELAMLHAPDGDRSQHIEDAPMAPPRRADLAGAGRFIRH